MAENDLVRLRPRDVAKVWGTALGQLIDLWRTGLMALTELGSGEQAISAGINRFRVPSADGRLPRLIAGDLVGETFQQRLDGRVVVFTVQDSGPGFVMVECSINQTGQQIDGDIYCGQIFSEDGKLVATVSLDAGS